MTDTLREQLLQRIGQRLLVIRKHNGYQTDIGREVLRGFRIPLDADFFPASNVMPGIEEAQLIAGDKLKAAFQIEVQGVAEFGDLNPSEKAELIFADLMECLFGNTAVLGFDSGGTFEITPADVITGATSNATAYVESITVDSGDWSSGDAAGSLILRRFSCEFQNNENLNVNGNNDVATVDGVLSYSSRLKNTTNDLADFLEYVRGNVDLPEAGQLAAGAKITFKVNYKSVIGNPYSQSI